MSDPNAAHTVPGAAGGAPLASTAPSGDRDRIHTAGALPGDKTALPGTSSAPVPAPAPLDLPTRDDHLPSTHAGAQPASATESLFAKAQGFAKPYLEQAKPYVDAAAAQAKPYADAALQKGKELKGKIEGTASPTATTTAGTATTAEGHTVDLTEPSSKTTNLHATGAAHPAATTGGAGTHEKGVLASGLATLQSAYNQVGAAIDAKTATPDKPGLFTQVSSAVQKGVAQIEKAVIQPLNPNTATDATPTHSTLAPGATATEGTATSATTATAPTTIPAPAEVSSATAHALAPTPTPAATTASAPAPSAATTAATTAPVSQHPVQTTTNTVPHNNDAGDQPLQ